MERQDAEFYLCKKARVNIRFNPESVPLCAMPPLPRRMLASLNA
jgi:hypothetical protein